MRLEDWGYCVFCRCVIMPQGHREQPSRSGETVQEMPEEHEVCDCLCHREQQPAQISTVLYVSSDVEHGVALREQVRQR